MNEVLSILGVVFGVAGAILTALSYWLSRKSDRALSQIQELNRSIADQTRRPLRGIEDILLTCQALLDDAIDGGRFWFLGMTLGMGFPHRFRKGTGGASGEGIDALLKHCSPRAPSFDDLCAQVKNGLCANVSSNSTVVCLENTEGTLRSRFLAPLVSRREAYRHMTEAQVSRVLGEVIAAHNEIAARVPRARPVKTLGSVPLQILVAELKDKDMNGLHKRACVVFLVGTENVGSTRLDDGEVGFFSASEEICRMFAEVVESLYHA